MAWWQVLLGVVAGLVLLYAVLLGLPRVVVIPGASSVEQLEFNVAAADLDLAADELAALTAAARAFTAVGALPTLVERVRERLGV